MTGNTYVQIKLASSICSSAAILTTVIRLFMRRRKFWIDDVCALISMLCVTVQMAFILTIRPPYFIAYYVIFATFYSTVWFARLSILLTIIRLGSGKQSRYLFIVLILFILLFGVLIGQLFWVCEPQRRQGIAVCKPTRQIAILKLVSDVIADLFLLVASVHLFLVIQDRALRFRLSCLFSTCVMTTVVSLVNSSFILGSKGLKVVIVVLVEGSISLIVCNIPLLSNICSRIGEHPRVHTRADNASEIQFAKNIPAQRSSALFDTYPIPNMTSINTSPTDATAFDIQEHNQDPDSIPDTPIHDVCVAFRD